MAKGGGGKGGGGKGGGGGGGGKGGGGGGKRGGSGSTAASAPAAAPAAASSSVFTPTQSKQQAKQESKAVKQETKTAQKTTAQAAREVKKRGEIANLQAYNQALSVLQQTKPKAAVKAETKFGKAQTKATAKGLGVPTNTSSPGGTTAPDNQLFPVELPLPDKKPEEPEFDIQGYLDEQFGELGSNVTGQLSQFQDLLSQMKSQKADQIDGAQKADQSDGGGGASVSPAESGDFKPFDPDLFTNLLEQVQGGSSMKQREQLQDFKEKDEARDYAQALKAYKF
jgi:hypothetical protein